MKQFRWHKANTPAALERFYKSILPKIRKAARRHGYAIGVHGSLRRDLDLIAAPWVKNHSDKDKLARAIHRAACGITMKQYDWTSQPKPCGRVSASFPICWTNMKRPNAGHIDLSVMPDIEELIFTDGERNPK